MVFIFVCVLYDSMNFTHTMRDTENWSLCHVTGNRAMWSAAVSDSMHHRRNSELNQQIN